MNHLKDIWQTAETKNLPGSEEALAGIRRFRLRRLVRKTAVIVLTVVMTSLMLRVVIEGPNDVSTRIGETLIGAGYLVLIFSSMNSLRRAYDQIKRSNLEFLEYLEEGQRGRMYFYQKIQPLTFLFMSLGVYFFIYESIADDFGSMLKIYSLLTATLVFLWYFVRPRIYQKQMQRLLVSIEKVKALQETLN